MNNPGLNISGVIFQAPLFGTHPHKEPTGIKEFLTIDQADNIQDLVINPQINLTGIAKNKKVLQWFLSNKTVVPMFGGKQIAIVFKYLKALRYNAHEFKYPTLVMMSEYDKVVHNDHGKKVFEKFGSADKELKEFSDENAYHEMHQEESIQVEVFKKALSWYEERIKANKTKKLGDFTALAEMDENQKSKLIFGLLKHKPPMKNKGLKLTILVVIYYLIGYLLMITKLVNADRGDMIISWPITLLYQIMGKRKQFKPRF